MKITKQQLKQIIREELLKEVSLEDKVQDNEHYITKIRIAISDLWSFYKEVNEDINVLRLDLLDFMSTGERPSRFAEPDVVRGRAKPTTDTNPGGRRPWEEETDTQLEQIIKEEFKKILDETDLGETKKKRKKENQLFRSHHS